MDASEPGPEPLSNDNSSSAPRLTVDVMRRAPAWQNAVEDELLVCAATAAFDAAGESVAPAELSLLLSDDQEIRALNKSWRGKDQATNVLSFPLDAPPCGTDTHPLGDVALAYETIAREAAERRIPVSQHAAHLVVHGVLHLMGYNHANTSQARKMEALEVKVLSGLGLPDPYALESMTSGEG